MVLEGIGDNAGISIIDDIIQGVSDIYFYGGISGYIHLFDVKQIIEKYKFPESDKEKSGMLNWLKGYNLELYNKIQWY